MIPVGTWRRRRTTPIEDQILARLPSLAHFFGLHPWHVPRLRGLEWERYRDAVDELEREASTKAR